MLVREEVFFAAQLVPSQESQALCSERLGGPALYFPVLSDPGERRHWLYVCPCLITAGLYTTLGMVSVLAYYTYSQADGAISGVVMLKVLISA